MSSANFSIEPETPSASTTATSFADFTISILSALSTVTVVPALKPILVGACATALRETGEQRVEREAALFHRAQRHISRHQLGDGGRIPGLRGIFRMQHLAGVGIDQQHRFGIGAGGGA